MASEGRMFDPFATKPRIVLVFDPETVKADEVLGIVKQALEIPRLPGFRGCLPCASSGFDFAAFESKVLPQVK